MYRFFEILPGATIWLTFFLMIFLSWQLPLAVAVFIILYDVFWLLRTVYFFILLHITFKRMKDNTRINWLKKLEKLEALPPGLPQWQDIYHLVIFPMHKEPYKLVEETFEKLAATNYPLGRLIPVLTYEEAGGAEAEETAKKIKEKFENKFFRLLVTKHPDGLLGEIPGKGSNETWGGRRAQESIIDPLAIPYENILISTCDVDSQLFPEYFGILTYKFLTCEKPYRSSFQPVPLFINNVFEAPIFARLVAFSSTFWNMMQQCRAENLVTFSSHSMPFKSLVEIGFWQTNVVSEDSRIFWQCLVHYDGDWRAEPLFYPISMDANVAPSFSRTLVNVYKQQRRWAWGAENQAYIFTNFIKKPKIKRKFYWTWNMIEASHTWATSSFILFSLGWLPILLGGDVFTTTLISHNLPQLTGYLMNFSSIGIVSSAILSVMLLPPKPEWFRRRHYIFYALEWIFMPLLFIFLSSLPSIEAQTRLMLGGRYRLGFWVTPKSRKAVSATASSSTQASHS